MKTLLFKEFGSSLGTRFLGLNIRNKILQDLNAGNRVVFDFEGVELISNSFADECFGKLLLNFDLNFIKANTTFRNLNKDIVRVVKYAIMERETQPELTE